MCSSSFAALRDFFLMFGRSQIHIQIFEQARYLYMYLLTVLFSLTHLRKVHNFGKLFEEGAEEA